MKYSVKLYGHLSEDIDRFCSQLADVLKIGVEDASALMQNVPVVVLSGAPKNQAERLAQDLAAIRALYLVEPEGQESEAEEPAPPLPYVQPDLDRPVEDEGEKLRKGYWGMALLLGAGAVVLIVGLVGLFSTYKSVRSEHQPAVTAPKVDKSQSQTVIDSAQTEQTRAELHERITHLEVRNEHIKSLIELKRQDLKAQDVSSHKDLGLLRRTRRELAELGEELRSNLHEIQELHKMGQQHVPSSPAHFQ